MTSYCPFLVAWLWRMVYPDHDEGPDRGTQDHHPRKIS